ncbi:MAG: hypothetical protein FJW14_12425 [Acidimicrobiia bacterium]|nr:hypothetical protein [Acidimicrobiia bacterium]
MADSSVIWEESALKLLETRDRYTRNAIREEFGRDPEKGAIEIDPAEHSYLTPVSGNRFSVIWQRYAGRVLVRAVVPLTNLDWLKKVAADTKKDYVGQVVKSESKGEITL